MVDFHNLLAALKEYISLVTSKLLFNLKIVYKVLKNY